MNIEQYTIRTTTLDSVRDLKALISSLCQALKDNKYYDKNAIYYYLAFSKLCSEHRRNWINIYQYNA